MTDTKALGIFDLTEPCILTFRSLEKPRAFQKDGKDRGEPKFDGTFLFAPDSADLKALKAKAVAVARAKWPNVDLKTLLFPFKNGNARLAKETEKAKAAGKEPSPISLAEKGKVVLTARSKFRPNLAAMINGKLEDLNSDDAITKYIGQFYSGALVFATFNLVAYEGVRDGDQNGVNAYLNAVATLNKGEKIAGGAASAAERFSGYAGAASDFDPTGGVADDDFTL